ncbi:MAG: phosphoadenylyl-sulfate reductase, partial [Chloroflexi bacterium]|nr:phosphoadenylyl-sulfate reductase [Chloroflexota bacterium]
MTKQLQKPDAEKLAEINDRLESATPQEVLLWAHEELGDDVALMSSFGLEDMSLHPMFWRITPDARV